MASWMEAAIVVSVVLVFLGTGWVTLGALMGRYVIGPRLLSVLVASLLVETGTAVVIAFTDIGTCQECDPCPDSPDCQDCPDPILILRDLRPEIRAVSVAAVNEKAGHLLRRLQEAEDDREVAGARLADLQSMIDQIKLERSECENNLQACVARRDELQNRISGVERQFLFRLIEFNERARRIGDTLNLTYQPDLEKEQLATLLLELFGELDVTPVQRDGDEEVTAFAKRTLIAYQETQGFGVTGFYGPSTFYALLRDYSQRSGNGQPSSG